jgi:hypothetical protein
MLLSSIANAYDGVPSLFQRTSHGASKKPAGAFCPTFRPLRPRDIQYFGEEEPSASARQMGKSNSGPQELPLLAHLLLGLPKSPG